MRRRLIALAVVVAAFTALAAAPASQAARVPYMRGVTFSEWGPTAFNQSLTVKRLKYLKKLHVDTVTIFVVWMQQDRNATLIAPGDETADESNLTAAIKNARKLGFKVVLRPYIDLADGDWRGNLTPSDEGAWRKSYSDFIMHFARVAGKLKVQGLVVGSETNTEQDAALWRGLVAQVRGVFHGFITYEANWDFFDTIDYWDAFDAIDISSYFPTSNKVGSSVGELVAGWNHYVGPHAAAGRSEANWVQIVKAISAKYNRPVFFGEIGYRTVDQASVQPFNVEDKFNRDSGAQARAYEAAFRVWYKLPFFRGFNWWIITPDPHIIDGQVGSDYRPAAGAINVLKKYYKKAPRK